MDVLKNDPNAQRDTPAYHDPPHLRDYFTLGVKSETLYIIIECKYSKYIGCH